MLQEMARTGNQIGGGDPGADAALVEGAHGKHVRRGVEETREDIEQAIGLPEGQGVSGSVGWEGEKVGRQPAPARC